jgi:hypothetical protein
MARSGKLKTASIERNEPLETLIPRLIEETGSVLRASMELGVAPTSIRAWLKRNGYSIESKQQTTLVKE